MFFSVKEKEESMPIFQFGPKETSTLSFEELTKQTSGFPKTSKKREESCDENDAEKVEMTISASEVSCVEEKPKEKRCGDGKNDVEMIFEKVPSPEQKERAWRYELPETFYCEDDTVLVEAKSTENEITEDKPDVVDER